MNKKLLSSALALTLAAGITSASPSFASTLSDRLVQWGITADLHLFNQKFFNKSSVRGGYNFEVDPSFNEGLFTRFDRYYFDVNLGNKGVSSIQEATEKEFSIGLTMKHHMELEFARQFENSQKALTALPYTFKNIPLSTEKAIEGLKVGDFVSLKSNLSLIVGADFVKAMNVNMGVGTALNYVVTGEFQVHVLRLPENKVRLKLVGLRSKGKELSISAGYAGVLNIFPVEIVNKRITRVLDLNPVQFTYNDGKSNLFMVDYVLDLKNKEVGNAYDDVLGQIGDLETLKIMNPVGGSEKLRDSLIMDISAIDSIFVQDQVRGKAERVQRSFRGSADANSDGAKLKLGIRMIRFEGSARYSENRIASVTDDSTRENYVLNSFKSVTEGSLFFSFFEVRKESQMNALFVSDKNYQNLQPENIVVSAERRDKRFRKQELETLKNQLRRTIPASIFSQIDFANWNKENARIKNNVAARYSVVLQPDSIAAAPEIDKKEIVERYKAYLKTIPTGSIKLGSIDKLDNRLAPVAAKLEKVFSSKVSDIERVNTLMSLRKSIVFKTTGIGFLLSLLPQHKLQDLIHFELKMDSTDGDELSYTFGNQDISPIYKKLLYIQSIMDDDGLDVRLQSEMIGLQVREGVSL